MPLDDKTFDAILSGKPATAPASDMAGGAITDIIRGAAAKYDIDPDIMVSLANRESGLRPDAKNPQSSAGGLFQFIDGTWKQYGRGDKFDPVANADAAARMLRENLDRFGGNYDAALAAHHVGPGKALQALRDGSIGDVNVSTQKWLADIKGQRQLNDELKAQKRNAFLAEDNPEYRPDFGGDIRPSAGSRSAFQAIGDTGASVLKGVGHFGESMGGLYGLATGDVDPNIVQNGGKALADFAESLKSDFIKNKERLSQQDIDAAEGHFNKFATAAWSNMSDPALFVNFFAEQAINFVPGMAAGRIAKGIIAGLGGASAAAIEAAPLAQKAMLMKRLETAGQVGTGVSVATGAVLQGADAGNSAYQQVMGRPQTEWDANPDYQRLVTTHGIDGAKQQIALQEARAAFAKSAVMSAGLNSVAPAHSIDKILVNGLKNKALTTAGREVVEKAAGQTLTRAAGTGAVKGFLGESASEALDEGYSQYAANEAEAAVNPNKDLLDDVAQNAGLGAAFGPMGAVTGGIEGHTRRKSAQELLQIATQQAAAQPNSPLSRAAAAAGPAVQASEQVAAEQVAAADPLAEQVAAIGDRLNDRAIYDAIRSHENLGQQALSDILGAYRVASNFNLDIKQRQAAVERLNNFFQLFDNQPNFTMGANGEAEQGGPLVPAGRGGESRRQESNVPTYDVGAPALGYQRRGDTLTDERAKQAAAAEYEQAYQDLVKAEQLGAGDQELMQRQMALRQAEARLQEIQRTIDGNRQLDSAAKRDAMLGDVLAALPPGQNPNRAFDRALRNAGFNETQFSEAERAKIAQWQQLSDGFMQQDAEPSRPNEMDAAALGIKEKQAAQAPSNPNLAKVDAMLQAGMQRKGDKMFDPRTGKSVKLSPAQIARAKHVERQNDRNRVMPAYQRAIEQRTRELEQLLSDPNHDEAAAVRLARGLSGLKQMVEQLQRGASLDEAIGNVFGQVGSQFANQLKNPNQRKDDAGDAPAAVESAPQPKAPRGGSRLTPLQDERLAQYGDDLQAMAGDAGWAEEGGKLIRNDDGTMSRTRWIPRAEWFVAGMLNNPEASEEAVRKALAGEPMYRAEKLHVMGMMDFLDAQGLSDAGNDVLDSTDAAISEDSDFGLPDYSAETAAVIELEFAQGSVDVPAFLEAIGANDEENDVTENETGAGQAGSASGEGAQAGREDGQDAPGAGRAGSQSQGFGLTGQTNEQAAAEYAQQQAEQPADITKAQADKERDAVPFSLSQQSQPKPQGVQGGLFTADGRASVAAKQEEPKPFDEAARANERQALYEKTREEAKANPLRTEELSKVMPAFDAETERLRKAANQNTIKNETPSVANDSGVSVGKNQESIKKADRPGAETVTAPEKSEASNKPEVSTHQTGVTFEQWKRAVPSLGKVNGWTLFEDKRVGDHYVLMTPYNSVRFDTEQQARDWAKENKAVAGDFSDKLRVEVRERLEAMTAQQVAATYKAMNLAGDKQGTWELGKALLQEDPQEVLDAMSGLASADDGEPNLEAAKALIQEAKETHGDKRKEAIVRKKARELAQKTPLSDEKTVLALDMVSTRLGMGDGGTKALEFLPAESQANAAAPDTVVGREQSVAEKATVNAENEVKPKSESTGAGSWLVEFEAAKTDGDKARIQALYDKVRVALNGVAQKHGDAAVADLERLKKEIEEYAAKQRDDVSKNSEKTNTSPEPVHESAKNVHDFSKFILISADSIDKLRKIDVERVLSQGAVKEFRQDFANWVKAKRPELAGEVDEVMAELAGNKPTAAQAKTGLDKAADAIDAKIDDVAARLAAKFKASRGTLNSGVDPELLVLGAELGSLYIAKGVVKFAQYARAVLDKLKEFGVDAEEVKPMLKKFYLAAQDGVDDATFDQMDDPRTVRNFDLDSLDVADSIQDKIAAAEQATNHDATPAQKEAGNYAKGKFPWNGLTISVETAKGEDRTDKETNGEKWRVTMPATYGYILRTTGADGDHVDAFMGPNPESDKVFVINQTQAGSEKFDEHKVMLGYPSERAAKADYLASFSDGFGRKVFGSIEGPFSVDEFRRMLDDGEFERKQEIDFGRRLSERTPLSDITVTVDAVEAETGRTVEMDENAADALKDVDDRMKLARSLLECLAS